MNYCDANDSIEYLKNKGIVKEQENEYTLTNCENTQIDEFSQHKNMENSENILNTIEYKNNEFVIKKKRSMLKRFINYKECCTNDSDQYWILFIGFSILITFNIFYALFHIYKFGSNGTIILLLVVFILTLILLLPMGILIYYWLLPEIIPRQKIENNEKLYV